MPHESISDDSKQKWQSIFAEYDRTAKTYTTMGALHTLAQYWVENEIIIKRAANEEAETNGPKWIPDYNDEHSIGEFRAEQDLAREMHDKTMIPMHRYSCIVMLYSTVEKELCRLVRNIENEKGSQQIRLQDVKAKSHVARVGKFVEDACGVKFSDCPQYAALSDLQKIRDCIIHCQGELALSRDKEYLVKIKRRGFFAHPNNDILIYEECIQQFLVEIWKFFVSVFGALGWKIASHWQGDKLEKTFAKLPK